MRSGQESKSHFIMNLGRGGGGGRGGLCMCVVVVVLYFIRALYSMSRVRKGCCLLFIVSEDYLNSSVTQFNMFLTSHPVPHE